MLAFEDLHWADPTSVLLLEQLLSLAEDMPVVLVLSLRPERDHGSWGLREHAGREFPHLLREIDLGPLGARGRRASRRARRAGRAPRRARAARAGGGRRQSVLPRGARPLARRRRRARAHGRRLALRPRRRGRGAADRGEGHPRAARPPLARRRAELVTAASALGRTFALPLLEGVVGDVPADSLHELQRLGLLRQSRRWPQPEFRFRHALIQETAYRTLLGRAADRPPPPRGGVARGAVRRARRRGARPARAPLARGGGRGQGRGLPPARAATRHASSTRSTRRSSTTVRSFRSSSSAASARRSRSSSSSSRSRSTRRFVSPRRTRRISARSCTGRRRRRRESATATTANRD